MGTLCICDNIKSNQIKSNLFAQQLTLYRQNHIHLHVLKTYYIVLLQNIVMKKNIIQKSQSHDMDHITFVNKSFLHNMTFNDANKTCVCLLGVCLAYHTLK